MEMIFSLYLAKTAVTDATRPTLSVHWIKMIILVIKNKSRLTAASIQFAPKDTFFELFYGKIGGVG
jgi:hypothetical protein